MCVCVSVCVSERERERERARETWGECSMEKKIRMSTVVFSPGLTTIQNGRTDKTMRA